MPDSRRCPTDGVSALGVDVQSRDQGHHHLKAQFGEKGGAQRGRFSIMLRPKECRFCREGLPWTAPTALEAVEFILVDVWELFLVFVAQGSLALVAGDVFFHVAEQG